MSHTPLLPGQHTDTRLTHVCTCALHCRPHKAVPSDEQHHEHAGRGGARDDEDEELAGKAGGTLDTLRSDSVTHTGGWWARHDNSHRGSKDFVITVRAARSEATGPYAEHPGSESPWQHRRCHDPGAECAQQAVLHTSKDPMPAGPPTFMQFRTMGCSGAFLPSELPWKDYASCGHSGRLTRSSTPAAQHGLPKLHPAHIQAAATPPHTAAVPTILSAPEGQTLEPGGQMSHCMQLVRNNTFKPGASSHDGRVTG